MSPHIIALAAFTGLLLASCGGGGGGGGGNVDDTKGTPPASPVEDQSFTTDEDQLLTASLSLSRSSDNFRYKLDDAPASGTFRFASDDSATFTYTPADNWHGTETVGISVTEADQIYPAILTFTVVPVDDPLVAGPQSHTTPEDMPVSLQLATDPDADPIDLVVTTAPAHGTVATAADGSAIYTPTADYHGSDSFAFTAGQGGTVLGPFTADISITPINDAPRHDDLGLVTDEDTALTFTIAPTDAEGDPITVSIATGGIGGDLAFSGPNELTLTPAADFNGEISFDLQLFDGVDTGTFNILVQVRPVDDPPELSTTTFTADRGVETTIALPVIEVDGDPMTITSPSDHSDHGVYTIDGSKLIYRSATGFHGTDQIDLVLDDGASAVPVTLSIEVDRNRSAHADLVSGAWFVSQRSSLPWYVVDISDDGRLVLTETASQEIEGHWHSKSSDAFLWNTETGTVEHIWPNRPRHNDSDDFTGSRMSGDARFIVTTSGWNQGLPGDSATHADILLIDRQSDSRTILSHAADGTPANHSSHSPSLSEAGDRVVFLSQATNLSATDTNNRTDAFLWDGRAETPVLRRIGERLEGATLIEPDWGIAPAVLSGDGSTIAFTSRSNGILPGQTTSLGQVYHYDIATDTTVLVTDDGTGQPQTDRWYDVVDISHDGRFILYRGDELHLYDADSHSSQQITSGGDLGNRHDLTPDGRFVLLTSSAQLLPTDTDGSQDLYLFDREAAAPGLTLLDVAALPEPDAALRPPTGIASAVITPDAGQVAFAGPEHHHHGLPANGVAHPRHVDLASGSGTSPVLPAHFVADGDHFERQGRDLDDAGQLVVFSSRASNLSPQRNDAVADDIFLYDSASGMTELLSRAADGTPANGPSRLPSISGDGRWVAFVTSATNLVGGVAPGTSRIVRLDRNDHSFTLIDTLPGGNLAYRDRWLRLQISDDGNVIAVHTGDALLPGIPGSFNRLYRVVVDDAGASTLVSKDHLGNPINRGSGSWGGSGDLAWLAFSFDANDESVTHQSIYRYSAASDDLVRISANASGGPLEFLADHPSISDDGSRIAFYTTATDVAGQEGVDATAFVWIDGSGFKALSIPDDTSQQWYPTISGDGRQVHLGSGIRRRYDLDLDVITLVGQARGDVATNQDGRSMVGISTSTHDLPELSGISGELHRIVLSHTSLLEGITGMTSSGRYLLVCARDR